ncbi:MAG TPA: LysR family transcriptional regulator [Bdellovibrionales bacterium]|nr:LysR family transcriptional regulator [Bdellovibrionales bacterium]
MDNIHWQLSILSKAIHYKNLSAAATHVGLSQPQLSRIISRLESELGVVLLDRTARRKSGWTPVAFKIADTYFRTSRKLTQALQQLKSDDNVTQITIGTLEGLIPLANSFCKQLIDSKMHMIELNVYDLSELEERFDRDEIDLIFTCREPGKHKYKNVRQLGYQVIQKQGDSTALRVFSQFEYASHVNTRKATSKDGRVLMSNSLAVRMQWIQEFGGGGFVPSDVRRQKKAETDVPVVMVATDVINPALWQRFEQIRL